MSLEDYFKVSPEDAGTFTEAISNSLSFMDPAGKEVVADLSDFGVQSTSSMNEISTKHVEIQFGYHENDFIWHITPKTKNITFNDSQLIYVTAMVLNKTIPTHIKVNIFLPEANWDIRPYTFKAEGLVSLWSFSDDMVNRINKELIVQLDALIGN